MPARTRYFLTEIDRIFRETEMKHGLSQTPSMTTRKVPTSGVGRNPRYSRGRFLPQSAAGYRPRCTICKAWLCKLLRDAEIGQFYGGNVGLDNDRDGYGRRPLYHAGGVLVAAILLAVCRYAIPVGSHDLAEVNVNTTYFHVVSVRGFLGAVVAPGIQKIAVSTIHSRMP
jgi:hypothetical protein